MNQEEHMPDMCQHISQTQKAGTYAAHIDTSHKKTDLGIYDTDFSRIQSMMSAESNSKKSVSYATHAHPSFGMTTTKTLRSVFL